MTIHNVPTVLIVEDERAVAELYATWLADDYEVHVAHSGREGLDLYDDEVDIVLLDRRMPGMPGREVLERIRSGPGRSRVAMVTAVEPSVDVVDLGFDDYVVKPVDRGTLSETVEALAARSEYPDSLREYFALVSKRSAVSSTQRRSEVSTDVARLEERIESLEEQLDVLSEELNASDFRVALRSETRSTLRQTAA